MRGDVVRDGVAAGAFAAVVSGAPSTLWAIAAGDDPLEPTLAAGSMLLPNETRRGRLVLAAAPVHATVSLGWAIALAHLLPPRRTIVVGALAGLGIAALDLGVVGRLFPRIRALPLVPQLADHVVYGAAIGFVLERRRR